MKPTFLALTALGAIAAATPALAQGYGYGYQGNNDRYYNNYSNSRGSAYGYDDRADAGLSVDARIGRLEAELNAGIRAGTIDRDEAMRLRAELRDLRATNRRYGYGGLTASERADLMARLRDVRDDIRGAEGSTSYGYNNGYGGSYSGSYGSTYGNGYSGSYGSSGTYNGYGSSYSGSYNNGYRGQGGPYEEVSTYGALRIGDRATSSLYAVPDYLRNTYRDGYGYYYRSDGNAVYQIDTRSGTVMRVYPLNR